MWNLRGKSALVVGLARSGVAAANLLLEQGAAVRVTDLRESGQLGTQLARLQGPVDCRLGEHRTSDFRGADLIVLSPGVPSDIEPLQAARNAGVPVMGEIEFAYRFLRGTVVGVTGSNGKTTTTALIGAMHRQAGHRVEVAGNIGQPLADSVRRNLARSATRYVIELSSFQLESIETFRCDVALILNVTPDHQDRYPGFQAYAEAKSRILLNQRPGDAAVLNYDDSVAAAMQRHTAGRVCFFSRKETLQEGVFVRDGRVVIRRDGQEDAVLPVDQIGLPGGHNLENVVAAIWAGFLSDVPLQAMAEAVRTFPGVVHRLEWVAAHDGVDYYNDSKATNVDSTEKALLAFSRPIILIMGGLDKGGDFARLFQLVKERVGCVILIGQAAGHIARCLEGASQLVTADDLEEAVGVARREAVPGDVVLLSPGCASFDMFDDFEHRGDCFKQSVLSLGDKEGAE